MEEIYIQRRKPTLQIQFNDLALNWKYTTHNEMLEIFQGISNTYSTADWYFSSYRLKVVTVHKYIKKTIKYRWKRKNELLIKHSNVEPK